VTAGVGRQHPRPSRQPGPAAPALTSPPPPAAPTTRTSWGTHSNPPRSTSHSTRRRHSPRGANAQQAPGAGATAMKLSSLRGGSGAAERLRSRGRARAPGTRLLARGPAAGSAGGPGAAPRARGPHRGIGVVVHGDAARARAGEGAQAAWRGWAGGCPWPSAWGVQWRPLRPRSTPSGAAARRRRRENAVLSQLGAPDPAARSAAASASRGGGGRAGAHPRPWAARARPASWPGSAPGHGPSPPSEAPEAPAAAGSTAGHGGWRREPARPLSWRAT